MAGRKIGKALVVGAGIGGIRSALDLAETGYGVTLIDRSPHIGGILSKLDYQFPNNHCGMCRMLPLVSRDQGSQYCLRKGLFHENIDIMLSTELVSIEGEPGNFNVVLNRKKDLVDPEKCIGCGDCTAVCPIETLDEFNEKLTTRKAIYRPVPHTIPSHYVIDTSICTFCGECEKACPTKAISLTMGDRKRFRIMVVDDELIVRDSLRDWLDNEGYSADASESGEDALRKLDEAEYHLMLLDIKMSGMDGVDVLRAAKEKKPDLVVIMMTAYATIETAVEAMKIGALDYLVKPFDPEALIPMVNRIYEGFETGSGIQMNVGAVILSGGVEYVKPSDYGFNYGYGVYPGVVTSLEFERMLSGSGPGRGKIVNPATGLPVGRIAWLQCVGSRNAAINADYCSSVCCMFAIKEALLIRDRDESVETAVFYMDMRVFGKDFQEYYDRASSSGVRFERVRVHSVIPAGNGKLLVSYVGYDGGQIDEEFDMVVLSVGQRPAENTKNLAEALGFELNDHGFCRTDSFFLSRTSKPGIFAGGSFSGLKDIGESVIQAESASLAASRCIHERGGGIIPELNNPAVCRDVAADEPAVFIGVCTCNGTADRGLDAERIRHELMSDPAVKTVFLTDEMCTLSGWDALAAAAGESGANRILIAACQPYVYARKLNELGEKILLDPIYMDVVDIRSSLNRLEGGGREKTFDVILSEIRAGLAVLKYVEPYSGIEVDVARRALVVGGGISGMTAALGIADHGYSVDLVEKTPELGGNLRWIKRILDGSSPETLLAETIRRIEKHPLITVHLNSMVVSSYGSVGAFQTVVETSAGAVESLFHGTTIIATGGVESGSRAYNLEPCDGVMTQKELETALADGSLDASNLKNAVMIQCAGSREGDRNYCSRVCCSTSVKHALILKERNPDIDIYILYRDMTTYGFTEAYYTRARKKGVIFIPYSLDRKPEVLVEQKRIAVKIHEPFIGRELTINPDILVPATGIDPDLPRNLADVFNIEFDSHGFFKEADSKWRPVDSIREGVFACGLALGPRNIAESAASGEAAAVRALRILNRERLAASRITARVRESYCSLCERCIDACPYGARVVDAEIERILVNPAMCQGCGACAAVCPNSAAVLAGFNERQIFGRIEAALEVSSG